MGRVTDRRHSPTGDQDGNPDRGRLTVETASKGLGLAGKVHVPREMWDRLRPCNGVSRNKPAYQWPVSLDHVGATKHQVHAVQGP